MNFNTLTMLRAYDVGELVLVVYQRHLFISTTQLQLYLPIILADYINTTNRMNMGFNVSNLIVDVYFQVANLHRSFL